MTVLLVWVCFLFLIPMTGNSPPVGLGSTVLREEGQGQARRKGRGLGRASGWAAGGGGSGSQET